MNVLELYNDGYSDSSYYANCANKPAVEVHFLSGVHDDCGGVRLAVRSIKSQLCTLPEPQKKVSQFHPNQTINVGSMDRNSIVAISIV